MHGRLAWGQALLSEPATGPSAWLQQPGSIDGNTGTYMCRDPSVAVCGSDSRVLVFEDVPQAKSLWIKGTDFSVQKLIGSRWGFPSWCTT